MKLSGQTMHGQDGKKYYGQSSEFNILSMLGYLLIVTTKPICWKHMCLVVKNNN